MKYTWTTMLSGKVLVGLGLILGLIAGELAFAAPKNPPTVTSPTFANVTDTTATLGGTVTSDGGQPLTSRGVEWGTSSGNYPNSVTEGGIAVSTFTVGVTGLPPGTTIFFRAWATNPRGTSTSSESSFATTGGASAPTVINPSFADVTDVTATLGGRVDDDGGANITSSGVDWGTNNGGPYPNNVAGGTTGAGPFDFTVPVTGLPSSTTVYFVAWATNSADTTYSTQSSFTTNTPASPPTVINPSFSSVTTTSAILGGEVSDDGGATPSDYGIVWNTTSPAESGGTPVSIGSGSVTTFSQLVSGLPPGTLIYFKAYATNTAGTSYSGESSFTTDVALATLASPPSLANIQATSADLGGDVTDEGGGTVSARGVVWHTASPPESGGTSVPMGSGPGSFSQNVTGLPNGVTVYFRSYATNEAGTAYSSIDNFIPSGPATVTTPTVTNITHFSADLGGNVTADGGNPILERGTVWNTTGSPEVGVDNVDIEGGTTTGVFSHTVLLPAGTTIYYRAYASTVVGPGYSPEDSFATATEPTVQASNVTFPQVAGSALRISWTRGNGDGSIVVLRETATGKTDPQDGDDYTADTDYSAAPELPVNSSNFVVYKGSHNYIVVNGLNLSTNYSVAVYEYAGTGASTDYLQLNPAEADAPITKDHVVHNMAYNIDCKTCHNHGRFGSRDVELKAVCETCHNSSGDAAAKLEFDNHLSPSKNPGVDYVDCGVCHEMHNHGGANTTWSTNAISASSDYNRSFLRANVSKYISTAATEASLHADVPKRVAPHPDGDRPADTPQRAVEGGNDSTARGYCQNCHSLTSYHRSSNTAGADQCHDGQTGNCGGQETHCGECHEHNNRFIGVGGTVTCVECHDSLQPIADATVPPLDRPAITTKLDLNSTHIPGGSGVATEPDCLVCHEFGAHKGKKVRLLDADDGVTFYEQPTEGGITGGATTDTGEGELFEPNCLSCHDADGASYLPGTGDQTPSSPFTGSGSAPVIDAAAWTGAAHNRPVATSGSSPVTCIGDGTNGCHGSGHGSDQLALLAPISGAVITVTDTCYECHDADGPSLYDSQSEFTGANIPATSPSGTKVNQRHDVSAADQTYSGGVVGCGDCHLVHVDSSSNPVVDPDNGSALATYNVANSYTDDGASLDYDGGGNLDPVDPEGCADAGGTNCGSITEPDYIQFCLTCHDGVVPAGVTMSAGMIDIAAAYENKDHHGVVEGNAGSKTGKGGLKMPYVTAATDAVDEDPSAPYAAMQCTDCHGAHGTGNIFTLRESISIAGVQLQVGGANGCLDEPSYLGNTTYTLPLIGGQQTDHYWGAWCTFCHKAESHPGKVETDACTGGHMHNGGSF